MSLPTLKLYPHGFPKTPVRGVAVGFGVGRGVGFGVGFGVGAGVAVGLALQATAGRVSAAGVSDAEDVGLAIAVAGEPSGCN